MIKKELRIVAGVHGGFILQGITGTHHFETLNDADRFARETLIRIVLEKAKAAGTSSQKVLIETKDKIPKTASGDPVFMERIIHAGLTGRPDMVIS